MGIVVEAYKDKSTFEKLNSIGLSDSYMNLKRTEKGNTTETILILKNKEFITINLKDNGY